MVNYFILAVLCAVPPDVPQSEPPSIILPEMVQDVILPPEPKDEVVYRIGSLPVNWTPPPPVLHPQVIYQQHPQVIYQQHPQVIYRQPVQQYCPPSG